MKGWMEGWMDGMVHSSVVTIDLLKYSPAIYFLYFMLEF